MYYWWHSGTGLGSLDLTPVLDGTLKNYIVPRVLKDESPLRNWPLQVEKEISCAVLLGDGSINSPGETWLLPQSSSDFWDKVALCTSGWAGTPGPQFSASSELGYQCALSHSDLYILLCTQYLPLAREGQHIRHSLLSTATVLAYQVVTRSGLAVSECMLLQYAVSSSK